MEFLYRNASPVYKGVQPQQASTSLPSGMMSCLFAGTPSYKTARGKSASAPVPARSWWDAWNPTPVYKTVSTVACVDESGVSPDNGDAPDDAGGCGDAGDQAPEVVIL
jgi:hypothetical protein